MKGLCLVYDENSIANQELFLNLLDVNNVETRPVIKMDELPVSITTKSLETIDFTPSIGPQYLPIDGFHFL